MGQRVIKFILFKSLLGFVVIINMNLKIILIDPKPCELIMVKKKAGYNLLDV